MIRRNIAVLATLFVTAALGSTASAATTTSATSLPLTNDKIVMMKSIGGFTLDEKFATARQRLDGATCDHDECAVLSHGDLIGVVKDRGRVSLVEIATHSLPRTTLRGVTTNKGIGIGSRLFEVKKAYPRAQTARLDKTHQGIELDRAGTDLTTIFILHKHVVTTVGVMRMRPLRAQPTQPTRPHRQLMRALV